RVRRHARLPHRARSRRRRIGPGVPHDRSDPRRGARRVVSVHYVKGDDPILRDAAVDALVTELLGDDDRMLAVEEFVITADSRGAADALVDEEEEEVSGTPFGAALNAARTPPMMTGKRIVVVREIGNLAGAEVKMLQGYVEDPVPTTELVLVTGGSARRAPST